MWNGKDENGNELENSVYFYNLIVNGRTEEIKKKILIFQFLLWSYELNFKQQKTFTFPKL